MRTFTKILNWCSLMAVVAAAFLLGGCGKKKVSMPDYYTEPSLALYVDEFLAEAQARNITIDDETKSDLRIIKFVDDIAAERRKYGQSPGDEHLAGACTNVNVQDTVDVGLGKLRKEHVSWKEVWIAQDMKPGASSGKRSAVLRELVYHELGHCFLGLDHVAQVPHRIMSPAVSGDAQFLTQNWDQLMDNLFGVGQVQARMR